MFMRQGHLCLLHHFFIFSMLRTLNSLQEKGCQKSIKQWNSVYRYYKPSFILAQQLLWCRNLVKNLRMLTLLSNKQKLLNKPLVKKGRYQQEIQQAAYLKAPAGKYLCMIFVPFCKSVSNMYTYFTFQAWFDRKDSIWYQSDCIHSKAFMDSCGSV